MTFLRRFIAIIVAIVFTPVAFGLLWFGTGELIQNRLAGAIITIVGMAVLLVVVQTGHVSSAGLTLASVVVTAFGVAGAVSSRVFAVDVATSLGRFSPELGRGVGPWLGYGYVLALGLAFAASSIASWTARRPTDVSASPAIRVFLSVILALAAVIVGLGLITRADPALVIGGTVVLGLAVLVGMVSSAGLYITGIIVFIVGIVSFVVTSVATGIAGFELIAANGMRAGATSALEFGFVAAYGAVLLATGIVVRAGRVRAEKRAVKAEPDEPEEEKADATSPAPTV